MLKNSIYTLGLILFLGSLMSACKPTEVLTNKAELNLPANFEQTADSNKLSLANWKTFFEDTTLLGLIETALQNNYNFLSGAQKIEIAQAELRLNKGLLFPNISASVIPAQRRFGLYTMDGAGNASTFMTPDQIVPTHLPDYYMGFQTNWEVDVWGKLKNRKKASALRYLASREGQNLLQTQLIAEVANAYYSLLALDNELEIVRTASKIQKEAYEIIMVQKEAAAATELAVKQFEAQYQNSLALEMEVKQQIVMQENFIHALLGRYPQTINRDRNAFLKDSVQFLNSGLPSDLLRNRPDLREAALQVKAAKLNLKAANAAFYPSFNISGNIGFQAFSTQFFLNPESFAYALIGNLTAPLINRSAIKSQFKVANANQIEALYNYQKAILDAYVEVSNELSGMRNLEQVHQHKNHEVKALVQATEIAKDLYMTGSATYLEVLIAQNSSLKARLELVNVRKNQLQTRVNLYKTLGGGWN
jgi:NodT family efflux transporter outer membrane factor (OMF) lipoprotein